MIKFIATFTLISGALSIPIELDPSNEYLVDSTYYSDAADIRDPASPYNTDLAYVLEEELALFKDEDIVSYDTLTERQERETADTRIQLGGTFGQNDIFGSMESNSKPLKRVESVSALYCFFHVLSEDICVFS